MIRYPRLKTFLSVFPLTETTWGLRGGADEQWRIKLADERAIRAFSALLPYLDGRTATEEILQTVEHAGFHRGAAAAVLRQLEASSLLEDGDANGLSDAELTRFDAQIRFFSRFTHEGGAKFQAALRNARVGVLAGGRLGESMYGRLASAGFGEVVVLSRQRPEVEEWIERLSGPLTTVLHLDADAIWPASAGDLPALLIVCQDSHDPLLMEAVDSLSKRRSLPWLLVRSLDLHEGWVGPLFVPGETASYLSLEARYRTNMPRFAEYEAFDAHVRATERRVAAGALHAAFDLVASIAVIEAIKFVTGIRPPELLGKFLTIDLRSWETELHEVLRLPALDRQDASRPPVFPWKVATP